MRGNSNIKLITVSILLSYSQIFFSDKLLFGLLLLVVSFFNLSAGLAGIISIIASNGVAILMGINKQKIVAGTYGFNSLLVGLGLGIYFKFGLVLFLILIFASLLTFFMTLLFEGWLGKYKLPFLSLSFLFGIWIVSIASRQFTSLEINEYGIFIYNDISRNFSLNILKLHLYISDLGIPLSLKVYFNSLGAIFFQYNIYAGVVIAIGLLFTSRISFMLSLLGFYSAFFYYKIVGADFTELSYSYIGFNFILTAIAVGGFFVIPSVYSFLWVILLTPLISFLISGSVAVLGLFNLSTFSLPFNVVVILFLYALEFREKHFNRPQLVSVQNFSPEKNLYSFHNFKNRFGDKPLIPIALPFFGSWKINQAHQGEYTHKGKWRHAWDFVIVDDDSEFSNRGNNVSDYHCYNKAIIAAADGIVEEIDDGISDNILGEVNLIQNWGNTIVIKHSPWLYSQLSHIKAGSFQVAKGDIIKKGQLLAYVGNSGRSPAPHLHFQLQATPFVGSETINYPIANYLLESKESNSLKINSIPSENQIVQNIQVETSLKKAFGFIPGQEIFIKSEFEELSWKVEIDYFNNTYLYCDKSNSFAFFVKSDNQLTFTGFKGEKKSLLFKFYLAAYQVIFAFHTGITVEDVLPANTLRKSLNSVLQDFIAPFYIYIKPKFKLNYISKESYFDDSKIMLQSTFIQSKFRTYAFEFQIDEKGIKEWQIEFGNKKMIYYFNKE